MCMHALGINSRETDFGKHVCQLLKPIVYFRDNQARQHVQGHANYADAVTYTECRFGYDKTKGLLLRSGYRSGNRTHFV